MAENNQQSKGAFVAKPDSNGSFLWAKQTGIQQGWAMALNPTDNTLYVAGHLFGNIDPVDGVRKTNSFGSSDAVVMQIRQPYIPVAAAAAIQPAEHTVEQGIEKPIVKIKNDNTVYNIGIYPNPDNGQYTIAVPDEDLNIIIIVYDANGRLITAQSCPTGFTVLDLQKEKPGTYVFKIKNGRDLMDTRNIVKG